MRRLVFVTVMMLFTGMLVWGCGPSSCREDGRVFRPVDEKAAVFWDRQTTESAELLRGMAETFNSEWQGLPIKVERSGNYADIFRKITAGIHAKRLPAMAVSYESMTNEYIPTGAVAPLDALIADDELGLDAGELADFYPMMIETNRFKEYDGALYSFPFAKSLLMLYYNRRVLDEAGIASPPKTWDEFIEQCRMVKKQTGKFAHAVSADCSTLNGLIFSLGGAIIEGRETRYDSAEALDALRMYETLYNEQLAYLIPPGAYEDNMALAKDEIAFVLRSSSGLSDMMLLMDNDRERWGLTRIPQKDPATPATVLYGPNVCLFNTTEAQMRAAWAFVRHFTGTDASVRWSIETGYLPVRKSALQHPDMLAYWEEWPYNRAAYDCLAFALPEPNVAGWQQVRDLAARAVTEIMTGMRDAESAAAELKRQADAALARTARTRPDSQ